MDLYIARQLMGRRNAVGPDDVDADTPEDRLTADLIVASATLALTHARLAAVQAQLEVTGREVTYLQQHIRARPRVIWSAAIVGLGLLCAQSAVSAMPLGSRWAVAALAASFLTVLMTLSFWLMEGQFGAHLKAPVNGK